MDGETEVGEGREREEEERAAGRPRLGSRVDGGAAGGLVKKG